MSGGLGNQMFQYAFFLSMRARGKDCVIDDTLFHNTKMHNGFELAKLFQINYKQRISIWMKQIWFTILRKFKPQFLIYTDRPYQFCSDVYQSSKPYLMGDWLSTEYFKDIKESILETYTFHDVSSRNITLSKELHQCSSVSVHIRRGDYLKLPNYCVCDENYYKSSIKQVLSSVENPVFYVFSNEPSWCENFMKQFGINFKIVDWNQGKDSYQDMYLMTQCKHNIIANSTFSWWGAWLNQNPDKIVIAPKTWFRNNDYNINCPGWHLIDTIK